MPTKTVTVTFEVPDDTTLDELNLVLLDSLGEFQDSRTPAGIYVLGRYNAEYLQHHPNKMEQVRRRVDIVGSMRSSIDFPVTTVEDVRIKAGALLDRLTPIHAKKQAILLAWAGTQYCTEYAELWKDFAELTGWVQALHWIAGRGYCPWREESKDAHS